MTGSKGVVSFTVKKYMQMDSGCNYSDNKTFKVRIMCDIVSFILLFSVILFQQTYTNQKVTIFNKLFHSSYGEHRKLVINPAIASKKSTNFNNSGFILEGGMIVYFTVGLMKRFHTSGEY